MSARETRRTNPYGGGGYTCMTDVVCTKMRMAVTGEAGIKRGPGKRDFADSALVNAAWLKLPYIHKMILRDLYVYGHQIVAICRRYDIPVSRGSHWNTALREAQQAIEVKLKGE